MIPVRGRSQWLSLLAGPVLGLVSFVVAYFINPLGFGGRDALAAVPAFLLAIVVMLIGHNLAMHREVERASGFSDRIYEAVRDYLHVTKIGSPEIAFRYVLDRLPILIEVRNTALNVPDEVERSVEKLYDTLAFEKADRRIADWASTQGRLWKDLGDSYSVQRFRETHVQASRLAGKRKTGYSYRLLGKGPPQLNFILLSYPDGSTEVLFNWDFRLVGQNPTVLLSRDRDIVEMFAVQFELLWRSASLDHDRSATSSTSTM